MHARHDALAQPRAANSLKVAMLHAPGLQRRLLVSDDRALAIDDILRSTYLPEAACFVGGTVIIRTRSQLATALALIALDGSVEQLILCPPDVTDAAVANIAASTRACAIISDMSAPDIIFPRGCSWMKLDDNAHPPAPSATTSWQTKWLLFTSGTTGAPKMVSHTLAGLSGAIAPSLSDAQVVWGTFYDIRRYGGLQMLLRALLTGGSMILSNATEPVGMFLGRLAAGGVTHLAGTPSHWRRALMSPAITSIKPQYLRLSGEIADQTILDSLKSAFPGVPIGHAYASTEAGVGFEVRDGKEGFPASFLHRDGETEMKIVDGSLRIRSPRTASGYVGNASVLLDADGFVDTNDLVAQRGDRLYFMGRASGIINVGGLKVHPEEVEAIINAVPGVQLSRVRARKSPMTGAIVAADVMVRDAVIAGPALKGVILDTCRSVLAAHKVPVTLTFVDTLPMTPGGKLERTHA